ncbi:MAG: ERF family protein [Endomicrobia bacterium]|nr:ERF family protein [Endomicrobiia bacterium]
MEKEKNSIGLIYAKMCAILKEVDSIGKNKKNTQQGFAYRGIDDMYNALHNLFAKHEVFIISNVVDVKSNVLQSNGKNVYQTCMQVEFSFVASDGSSVVARTYADSLDMADKGSGKCLSYALKNVLTQTFLIPVEGTKDNDAEHIETSAPAPKQMPEHMRILAIQEIKASETEERLKSVYVKYKDYFETLKPEFEARKKQLTK